MKGFNVYSNEWDTFAGYDSIVTAMGNDAADGAVLRPQGQGAPSSCASATAWRPRRVDMAIHEGYMAGKRV